MKSSSAIIVIILFAMLVASCTLLENVKPEDLSADLSGVYVGKAEILITETQYWTDGTKIEDTLQDGLVDERITVTAIDIPNRQYQLEKTTEYFSFYDIASKQTLDSNYRWFLAYEYDKAWESSLQFDPENNTLEAIMLVEDIFENMGYDNSGNNTYYYFRKKSYRITAVR